LAAGDPVRVLDDVAYGAGVWRGVLRERTIAPLLPRFSSWPGRRTAR
jgi:mycofactocin glycosyltransferase